MSLVASKFNERVARFSPDGRSLAHVSDESGRDEVYLQPYPGPGNKIAVSLDGGAEPVWSRSGRELFYRSGNQLLSALVQTSPSLTAETPRVLFEGGFGMDGGGNTPWYDVFPDGARFVMIRHEASPSPEPAIVVVQGWFEELRRLAPRN